MGDRNGEQHTDPGNWQDTKHRINASDTQAVRAVCRNLNATAADRAAIVDVLVNADG